MLKCSSWLIFDFKVKSWHHSVSCNLLNRHDRGDAWQREVAETNCCLEKYIQYNIATVSWDQAASVIRYFRGDVSCCPPQDAKKCRKHQTQILNMKSWITSAWICSLSLFHHVVVNRGGSQRSVLPHYSLSDMKSRRLCLWINRKQPHWGRLWSFVGNCDAPVNSLVVFKCLTLSENYWCIEYIQQRLPGLYRNQLMQWMQVNLSERL